MNLRIMVLFILSILSLSPTLADNLTCQYRINETQSNETWIFYFEDVPLNITLLEAKELETWSVKNGIWPSDGYHSEYRFKVYNYYTSPINVTLDYIVDGHLGYRNISIDPKGYQTITGEGQNVELNTINYAITSPEYLTTNRGIISHDLENCKDCLGKTCLNDGEVCNLSQECGSGFCIRGYCSVSEGCFNNDCKCASDEIQCTDNKQCAKKSTVPIDVRPDCGLYQECVTNYINATTGLCAKSPTQLQEEEAQNLQNEEKRKAEALKRDEDYMKSIVSYLEVLLILAILTIATYRHLKIKQVRVEIAKLDKEAENARIEIEQIDKRLAETNNKIKDRDNELPQKEGDRELKRLIKERDELERERLTPRTINVDGVWHRPVVINENGYFQFVDNPKYPGKPGGLFHRWYAKKFIYYKDRRKYPLDWSRYEVHHKDETKLNNDLANLEILTKEEHGLRHAVKGN